MIPVSVTLISTLCHISVYVFPLSGIYKWHPSLAARFLEQYSLSVICYSVCVWCLIPGTSLLGAAENVTIKTVKEDTVFANITFQDWLTPTTSLSLSLHSHTHTHTHHHHHHHDKPWKWNKMNIFTCHSEVREWRNTMAELWAHDEMTSHCNHSYDGL